MVLEIEIAIDKKANYCYYCYRTNPLQLPENCRFREVGFLLSIRIFRTSCY
nr:MAG TPA: Putative zinc ribbon domain [Caudoviricetes sp.]